MSYNYEYYLSYTCQVDCTENSETCGKYGVSGYPTLKIFRGGELSSDYQGPRQSKGIVDYMRKQSGPSSKGKCVI